MNRCCRRALNKGPYLLYQWLARLVKAGTPPFVQKESLSSHVTQITAKGDLNRYHIVKYILTGQGFDEIKMDEYEQKYKKDWIPIYLMIADDDKIDSIPDYLLYNGWQDVCMSWTSMRPFELYLARTGKLPPPIYFKDIKAIQEKDSYAISKHYHPYTIELLYENKINIRPLKDINSGVYYNLLLLLMCEDIVYKATHYIQQDISFAKENIVYLFKFSCNTGAGVYDVPDIIKYDGWQKQRDEDGLTPIQYILNRCDDLIRCVIRPELYYDGWLQEKIPDDDGDKYTPAQLYLCTKRELPPAYLQYPGWEKSTVSYKDHELTMPQFWIQLMRKPVPPELQYDGWYVNTNKFIFNEYNEHEYTHMHYNGTIDDAYEVFGWKKNEQ